MDYMTKPLTLGNAKKQDRFGNLSLGKKKKNQLGEFGKGTVKDCIKKIHVVVVSIILLKLVRFQELKPSVKASRQRLNS